MPTLEEKVEGSQLSLRVEDFVPFFGPFWEYSFGEISL